jgi:hypothetical protein
LHDAETAFAGPNEASGEIERIPVTSGQEEFAVTVYRDAVDKVIYCVHVLARRTTSIINGRENCNFF